MTPCRFKKGDKSFSPLQRGRTAPREARRQGVTHTPLLLTHFFSIGWYPALSSFFFASSASSMSANGPTWILKNGFASSVDGARIKALNPFFFTSFSSLSASADLLTAPIW